MQLIWHGTASIELGCSQGRILFDPFVPLKGSTVNVSLRDFDGFGHIFVTHGHLDHIADLPRIVQRNPTAKIYCTATPYATLAKKGVPAGNLERITYGQELNVNGFCIRTFHGRHAVLPKASWRRIAYILRSPARTNIPHILRENHACKENDETVFYQLQAEGKTVQLMGSLNLRDDVTYPTGADLLVLPYNGWEDNFLPAVHAIERLRPRRVVLDHYDDTFPPVTTPMDLSPILRRFPDLVMPLELGSAVPLTKLRAVDGSVRGNVTQLMP